MTPHRRREEILALLKEGFYLTQIANTLKLTRPTIHAHIKRMLRDGMIAPDMRSSRKTYTLTAKGLTYLLDKANKSSLANTKANKTYQGTAHKFGLSYPLKDHLSPRQPPQLMQQIGITGRPIDLHNTAQVQFRVGRITIRLTTRSLLLYTKELYTDNRTLSIETEDAVKAQFDAVAQEYEERLQRIANFKLRRLSKNVLESHVVGQHWAEEHHPAAEQSATSPRVLARSRFDGQRRLGLDESKGHREWELYHTKTADVDKDVIDEEFNQLLDGQINLMDINALKEVVSGMVKERVEMHQADLALRKDIKKHLKALDERMKQIMEGKQKRLPP